ncbi:MAG: NAD(P)/FAD-dependent oxidoreductase [Nitrospira sp.]|nr:NAD(P)/FAD-dependent oxidoreductase [Nitrospira sp.]
MDIHVDVVVVGAGGGGAILGLSLARKGIRTLVLEQAPGPPHGIRGEILQPNGQIILDDLGLLDQLPQNAVQPVRHFHFRQVGGRRLCSVDYDDLPSPYNRALVTLPHVVHRTVLEALEKRNPGGLWYNASFTNVLKRDGITIGVEADVQGKPVRVSAKLVVGADGPTSKVRQALKIPAKLYLYPESYLVAILDCPEKLDEAQYFLGKKEILGVFPAAKEKIYLVYLIDAAARDAIHTAGVEPLQKRWSAICPELSATFHGFTGWEQSAVMPTGRTRARTWVTNGAVLIGDAAHGMNPHASQGRMQAMVDATVLADLIPSCLAEDNFGESRLKVYEQQRRPKVEMLQRLADEEAFVWNTGNPVLAWLRNRVFFTIDKNQRLKYQVLTATAGLRETPPFGILDRFLALGLVPDPRADQRPPHALS